MGQLVRDRFGEIAQHGAVDALYNQFDGHPEDEFAIELAQRLALCDRDADGIIARRLRIILTDICRNALDDTVEFRGCLLVEGRQP